MSDPVVEAEEAYFKGRKACRSVMLDPGAAEAEKREASKRRQRMAAEYAQTVLDEFFSRTNMLSEIADELSGMKKTLEAGSAAPSLDAVSATLNDVNQVLAKDKNENG